MWRARLSGLVLVSLCAGGCVTWAMSLGYLRLPGVLNDAVFVVAGVAFLFGFTSLLFMWAWTSFRERFPSRERLMHIARNAERLGLRPAADAGQSVDRSFPFLGASRDGFAETWQDLIRIVLAIAAFTAWLLITLIYGMFLAVGAIGPVNGALILGGSSVILLGGTCLLARWPRWLMVRLGMRRPAARQGPPGRFTTGAMRPGRGRIAQLFAGRWNELDVRVFDYTYGDDRETTWTCALLSLEGTVGDLEVRRRSAATRIEDVFGRGGLTVGEADFDRVFRTLADQEREARRVLTTAVRARLLADVDPHRFLLQLHGREMLYCVFPVEIDGRGAVLEAAKRLRDVLPAG